MYIYINMNICIYEGYECIRKHIHGSPFLTDHIAQQRLDLLRLSVLNVQLRLRRPGVRWPIIGWLGRKMNVITPR